MLYSRGDGVVNSQPFDNSITIHRLSLSTTHNLFPHSTILNAHSERPVSSHMALLTAGLILFLQTRSDRPNVGYSAIDKRHSTSKHLTSRASQPRSEAMAAAGRGWKCGVCNAKAGDLVCGACVTREAERRRAERAKRLGALESVREAAAVAAQVLKKNHARFLCVKCDALW